MSDEQKNETKTPTSAEVVNDKSAKRIKELETKISELEVSGQTKDTELGELKKLVEAAKKVPSPVDSKRSILDDLNDLVSGNF